MGKWSVARRMAYVTVASAVLLELVLQVGSGVVWLVHRPGGETAAADPDARTILCVGDSWTFGVACSDPTTKSYPAQLQRILDEEAPGEGWRVVRRGVPGDNSRQLLGKLPGQLKEYQPEWVFILIGQNDNWSEPELLDLADSDQHVDEGSFRWTWRTGRLVAWAAGKLTARPDEAAPAGAEVAESPQPAASKGSETASAGGGKRGNAARPARGAGLGAMLEHYRNGDFEKADAELAVLQEKYDADRSQPAAEALLEALVMLGKSDEAFELGEEFLVGYPESSRIRWNHAKTRLERNDQRGAEQVLDELVALDYSPWMLSRRAKFFVRGKRVDEAARSVILRYLAEGNEDQAASDLGEVTFAVKPEIWASAVAAAECSDEDRDALGRIGEAAFDEKKDAEKASEITRILEAHLSQAIALCQDHSAQPVILSYAFDTEHLQEVRHRLAAEKGIGHVDIRELLTAVCEAQGRKRQAWKSYFAKEGHFNDKGYAQMARFVADHLLANRSTASAAK